MQRDGSGSNITGAQVLAVSGTDREVTVAADVRTGPVMDDIDLAVAKHDVSVLQHPVGEFAVLAGSQSSAGPKIFVEQRIGCLPVVDENEHVVGILTQTDLLHMLSNGMDDEAF